MHTLSLTHTHLHTYTHTHTHTHTHKTHNTDVLSALEYLHNLGIVHCDVKPPNILIAADERARLADFDVI